VNNVPFWRDNGGLTTSVISCCNFFKSSETEFSFRFLCDIKFLWAYLQNGIFVFSFDVVQPAV